MGRDRTRLAEFLRSRRDRLTPQQAGINPLPGEHRVPGLRRQELAMLAGVGADYDSRLEDHIDELRRADPDVARWWDDHRVREYSSAPRRIRPPVAGDLAFDVELLVAKQETDQHLVLDTVEPHSRTASTLPLLAAWGAETAAPVVITEDAGEP